jgi:PDZ domain-containing protein
MTDLPACQKQMSVVTLGLFKRTNEDSLSLFEEPSEHGPLRRRRAVGRVLLTVSLLLLSAVAIMPSPYVIERPGRVFNTLGSIDGKPMIEMGEKTYPTSGRLNLMTVSLVGSPEQTPSWFEIAQAWIDPAQVIIPLDEAFPANQTAEQSDAESKAMMEESQQDAVAAALIGLGYEVPRHLYVAEVSKGAPAAGKLVAKDFIEQANGIVIDSVETLRAVIKKNKTNPLTLVVNRAGKSVEETITPYLDGDTYRIGIFTGYTYDFPIKVTISAGDIGGPSGGMMFALAITDKLTPGSLTGGLNISGTGTIDPTGKIGAIGGIRQKMYAAVRADSKFFLAPAENCDEVVGAIPDGLNVIRVGTLADAKNAISKLVAGAKPASLPTCNK